MVFSHPDMIKKEGSFSFDGKVFATAHNCLDKTVIKEFWHGFSFRLSDIEISTTDRCVFAIGNAKELCHEGPAYAINVENDGVSITADSEKSLIMGCMTLLDLIYAKDDGDKTVLCIDCCEIKEAPLIKNRVVHYCIFPETELWEIERFIRFCGALKYSHIILEFWGMLRYDCMRELSWESAFSKDEIRPLISMAKDLGLEVIPMFNHWGHASACRVMNGKHVVLDQNPTLQTCFSEDGWCWDIRSEKVKKLLSSIRCELIELCGNSGYFHIGCDEAYNYDLSSKEGMDAICSYINGISRDLSKEGIRVIVWGDMFLYKYKDYDPSNKYCCHAPTPECERYMTEHLDPSVIVADWQYDATKAPVETSLVFKNRGLDCFICPWDRSVDKLNSCLDTAKEQDLFGIIHTTWHTLSQGMPYVLRAARGCFEAQSVRGRDSTYTAALLRRVYFVNGEYEKAGWARRQTHDIT